MIQIRPSTPADLPVLMDLYDSGRRIMRGNGNLYQWTKGYPSEEIVMQDIARGNSYLCLDEAEHPVGTFAFIVGADPTYARIYVAWLPPASTGVMRNCPTCGRTPTATTASCNTSC